MKGEKLRKLLEQRKGARKQLEEELSERKELLRTSARELKRAEQAREIIKEAGLLTQQQLQYHISDITTLALETVFNDPYTLEVNFVERRNKTECDLLFKRGDNAMKPMDASGGGAVDVASFALRVAGWAMQIPRSRNTIILDEPMRFLSKNHQEQASKMLSEISKRLGIQFIIVTHEDILAQYADKVFKVSMKKGRSIVE